MVANRESERMPSPLLRAFDPESTIIKVDQYVRNRRPGSEPLARSREVVEALADGAPVTVHIESLAIGISLRELPRPTDAITSASLHPVVPDQPLPTRIQRMRKAIFRR